MMVFALTDSFLVVLAHIHVVFNDVVLVLAKGNHLLLLALIVLLLQHLLSVLETRRGTHFNALAQSSFLGISQRS